MRTTTRTPARLLPWTFLAAGCIAGQDAALSDQDSTSEERVRIEESDLYKVDGTYLYIQNETSGLNIVDLEDRKNPALVARVDSLTGAPGDVYVDGDRVFVLLSSEGERCDLSDSLSEPYGHTLERSEIVTLTGAPLSPSVAGHVCLPGFTVASRKRDNLLYVVTENSAEWDENPDSWIFAIDVSNPAEPAVTDHEYFEGEAQEIHVTDEAIYLAQPVNGKTRLTYVDITDLTGTMVERDSLTLRGVPAGRFHMDARGDAFRIVTFSEESSSTNLFVVDTLDPDSLVVVGDLTDLAPGEELWATRFDDDMAYVVTYLRESPEPVDPLWVISLADDQPRVMGELEIPGWSTFLYPRDDRIMAVGRGDLGNQVAVSLLDVANPHSPRELRRLVFGDDWATSESNTDFRGVGIAAGGAFAETPIIAVPYTNSVWGDNGCVPEHRMQLVDIYTDDLALGGTWKPTAGQEGLIRRSRPVLDMLYSISDRGIAALDVFDHNHPIATGFVETAGEGFVDECPAIPEWATAGDDVVWDHVACSAAGAGRFNAWLAVLAGLLGVLRVRRRCTT